MHLMKNMTNNRFLETRLIALERDNYTCQHCNEPLEMARGRYAVHHLGYSSDEPDNLVSLCVRCHREAHANNNIEKRPSDTTVINLSDDTYWLLREKREEMSKSLNRHVSFGDVIQYLFTREKISLRQGE
jgi:hypothetical protein